MDANLIAATVLFGPGAVALPALAVAWHRSNRHADAERAMLADLHRQPTVSRPTPPTGPGQPITSPEPTAPATVTAPQADRPQDIAPVIDLITRRHRAA